MRRTKRWLFIVLAVLAAQGAWADSIGYRGTDPLGFVVTNGVLTARYANRSVELLDSAGKVLFHAPSPALTYLWISPDSEYVVGLSSVKLNNLYQLVVWRRDGTPLLLARHPESSDYSESVTASVHWFDEKNPEPKIVTTGGKLVLQLRSPSGRQMEISLTK